MSENNLKPCPFCGGTKIVIDGCKGLEECKLFEECDDEEFYAVVCDFTQGGCGASGGYRETKEQAITAWNKRSGDTSIKKRDAYITVLTKALLDHCAKDCNNTKKPFNCDHEECTTYRALLTGPTEAYELEQQRKGAGHCE